MALTPPKHLRADTAKWWRAVAKAYELEEHHARILTMAAEAWDRAQEAREEITRVGAYFDDRFGKPKAHPAVNVERDCRIQFARLIRELQFEGEKPPADPRPPRP